jgi:hypothetical protein
VSDDYVSLEDACDLSGFHPRSLKRLLRTGKISGSKEIVAGKRRWRVSRRSLERYINTPLHEFGFDRPGPKPYLSRLKR